MRKNFKTLKIITNIEDFSVIDRILVSIGQLLYQYIGHIAI